MPCPGVLLGWDDLPFWKTYPFHLHDPESKERPAYSFVSMVPPQIRSTRCLGPAITAHGYLPCTRCRSLSVDVDVLLDRARRSYQHINSEDVLNIVQLREKLAASRERENKLKLKNVNISDALVIPREHLTEYKDVVQFVGQNNVPALQRIFFNSVKRGWGIKTLRERLDLAVNKEYRAVNFPQHEIDLQILIYELGGAGAVHALSHSYFALPSLNTIQPYRRQNNIVPCVDGVRITDVLQNIAALFGPYTDKPGAKPSLSVERPAQLHGYTLSFDEVASDPRLDYMAGTDSIGGLCLEHIDALTTVKVGKDISSVEAAAAAVRTGKVHIASEISVGAISRLSQTGYGAKPVFMAPSCKKGGWRDLLKNMEIVVEAWRRSEHGEAKHGPLLSVASDGAAGRRAAMFMMTMHSEISPGNPLYESVRNLPGLNLRVGKNNLTGDVDWKHEDKRLCTCFCSPQGIVVKNICVNRDLLLSWLERLPDHDWSEMTLHSLLDPSDAQDVPRAIKLLLCIVEVAKLDSEEFDPSEMAEFEAICLLGELLDAWLQPFINVQLSLSEQIESLIKFSHLLCALYLQNGTSFLPNQLYGDLQITIKNAILMVPKTRLINGELKVFLCLLGDDVLESLFGRSRMIGGHSPNSSVAELQHRFNSAMNLDRIYERYPELERKPRRLAMFRMRHVDHLRPAHFQAELRAKSCDLEACWKAAVPMAESILQKFGVKMSVPFSQLFKRKATDLMRPFGGKYPAISAEVDRSMANLCSHQDPEIDESTTTGEQLTIDFEAMIASELAQLAAESEAGPHSVFTRINADGHLCHKKAVMRTLFDMTHDTHTSHDRLQRVRGFTTGGKSYLREDTVYGEKTSPATHFQLGNLFATLICHNGTHLGLAIAKCTVIKRGPLGSKSPSVSAIPRAELDLPSSPYTIAGQIYDLIPIPSTAGPLKWAWNGKLVSLSLLKKRKANGSGKEEISHLKNLQFSVPSCLIDPLQDKAEDFLTSELPVSSERDKTWVFMDADLLDSWYKLWNRLFADGDLHDKFPTFTGISEGSFPYSVPPSAACRSIIYSAPIAGTVIEQSNLTRHTCRVCQQPVKGTDRQIHVGRHILKAICGVPDTSVKFPVSNAYPCGMCGGPTNNGACKVEIKSGKALSTCPSAYSFMVVPASKFHKGRPCTNVPVVCALNCGETHWKYNFKKHLEERHPSWEQIASPAFLALLEISHAEQTALDIPVAKYLELLPRPTVLIPSTPTRNIVGRKRPASCTPRSRLAKENTATTPTRRASKTPKVDS
ncbi:hypothetical protein R3P38DRAFT_2590224 [Favolaschia claudopus]|uniref:C2H2-type domain-containing protein n=2 Tax=Favolaschia claudopus TaxID=2862362 RepID=A0AAV9Z0N6_9AGAR